MKGRIENNWHNCLGGSAAGGTFGGTRTLQEGWSQDFTITGLQVQYTVIHDYFEISVNGVIIFPLLGLTTDKIAGLWISGWKPVVLETRDITSVPVTADIRGGQGLHTGPCKHVCVRTCLCVCVCDCRIVPAFLPPWRPHAV